MWWRETDRRSAGRYSSKYADICFALVDVVSIERRRSQPLQFPKARRSRRPCAAALFLANFANEIQAVPSLRVGSRRQSEHATEQRNNKNVHVNTYTHKRRRYTQPASHNNRYNPAACQLADVVCLLLSAASTFPLGSIVGSLDPSYASVSARRSVHSGVEVVAEAHRVLAGGVLSGYDAGLADDGDPPSEGGGVVFVDDSTAPDILAGGSWGGTVTTEELPGGGLHRHVRTACIMFSMNYETAACSAGKRGALERQGNYTTPI